MTVDIRFVLFGGPYDGAASAFPSLPPALWVGPCQCRSDRPCGGVNAFSDRAVGDPRVRDVVGDDLVEYKRDRLMPDDRWRYVYADVAFARAHRRVARANWPTAVTATTGPKA